MAMIWTLTEHGEEKEREWWPEFQDYIPAYGEFWCLHVLPLTFRIIDHRLKYLRHKPPEVLRMMASLSYQTFFHFAKAFEIQRGLNFPKFGESLFDFYGRLYSALYSGGRFLNHVDDCCVRYGLCHKGYHWYKDRKYLKVHDDSVQVNKKVGVYRNSELHGITQILANMKGRPWKMPRRDRNKVDKYSGLSAVVELLMNPQQIEQDFVSVDETTREHLHESSRMLNEYWKVALQQMDPLGTNAAYLRDLEIADEEKQLAYQLVQDPRAYVVCDYVGSSR